MRTTELSGDTLPGVVGIDSGAMAGRLDLAIDAAGLPRNSFRWFRLQVEYPPICSLIAFECEQPAV